MAAVGCLLPGKTGYVVGNGAVAVVGEMKAAGELGILAVESFAFCGAVMFTAIAVVAKALPGFVRAC